MESSIKCNPNLRMNQIVCRFLFLSFTLYSVVFVGLILTFGIRADDRLLCPQSISMKESGDQHGFRASKRCGVATRSQWQLSWFGLEKKNKG